MRPDRRVERVYLHRAPIDMRRQMDGLAALVQGVMRKDPFTDSLFVFINRRRNKLKILTWEKNGFVIWYKRLERDKFVWPVKMSDVVVTLSGEQLNWLLDGYDVWRMTPHKSLAVAHIG